VVSSKAVPWLGLIIVVTGIGWGDVEGRGVVEGRGAVGTYQK